MQPFSWRALITNKFYFIIILIVMISSCLLGNNRPVLAKEYTVTEVIPNEINFKITSRDLDQNEKYYEAGQQVTVTSMQYTNTKCLWYLGIRAGNPYLVDSFNPSNRISVSHLRWSIDGVHFYSLSRQWTLVNSYNDLPNQIHTEAITYRLYNDGQLLPAGSFSVQIEFDSSLNPYPVN